MISNHKPIIIIDFGSQYTQLIARRIREMNVYCEVHPFNVEPQILENLKPAGIILSGGPATVTLTTTPKIPEWVFNANIPILGICYGMQALAHQLGGKVESSKMREFGYAEVNIKYSSPLLQDLADKKSTAGESLLDVWMSHGDKVMVLPEDFKIICASQNAPIAGMANENKNWYGLQFHPEVSHTIQGANILKRFVIDICKAETNWTSTNIIEETITNIRNQVGKEHVLLAISGGVDSSVVAALLHKAIGDQLICVFVDNGLLRLNEANEVLKMLGEHFGIKIISIIAEEKFLTALTKITCPEQKRKIAGRTFIEIFEEEAKKHSDVSWLAQGTIYPDVIESAATSINNASEVIKTHHNVGGLPETMNLRLIEPIRELFKDEVRKVGLELGLPEHLIQRHPFPGPGLAVRILGEVKKEYADILRQADAIFIEELYKADLYYKVSQAFAVFLPVKSVAVMGDGRRYDYVINLRAVTTDDFMTAHWAQLPWDFLAQVSSRIINEVPHISRVTYDISSKPPATIEWE